MPFIQELESLLKERKKSLPPDSYTTRLFESGLDRILQKFGEESVEYIISAKNSSREKKISEAADLLFHFLVSLVESNISYKDIILELKKRHQKTQTHEAK